MATHPPLCDRVAALSPRLASGPTSMARGKLRAFGVIGALLLLPILLTGSLMHNVIPSLKKAMHETNTAVEQPQAEHRQGAPDHTAAFKTAPAVLVDADLSPIAQADST